VCYNIEKGARLRVIAANGEFLHEEVAESDFLVHDKDLLCIMECGCGSPDCSGRAYIFSDGFGSRFWVHDSKVKKVRHAA
jgi:hypothetical protein